MLGYIANTDPNWFNFLKQNNITNPVFWFKRDNNPNSKCLVEDNYMFLRITNTNPPVMKAFGKIKNTKTLNVKSAFDLYGDRLGYSTVEKMIDVSSSWTSSVSLSPSTSIFCVELINLKTIREIRVDKDLEPLGILFDYQHIVTGKGLNDEQTSALLQITETISPVYDSKTHNGFDELASDHNIDDSNENEFSSDSARYLESHMQWFVFNNLQCLGIPGVKLYDEDIQQESQGKYRTDEVGEIDILLKSSNNDIYVVELKKAGTDKTVGQICRYMGWVQHRLAQNNETVFGMIVTQDYDHRLVYASQVVNNLAVKRIQISFKIKSEESELPE